MYSLKLSLSCSRSIYEKHCDANEEVSEGFLIRMACYKATICKKLTLQSVYIGLLVFQYAARRPTCVNSLKFLLRNFLTGKGCSLYAYNEFMCAPTLVVIMASLVLSILI